MIPDHRMARVFTVLSRAIWLGMAWAFGSMVGQMVLYARSSPAF